MHGQPDRLPKRDRRQLDTRMAQAFLCQCSVKRGDSLWLTMGRKQTAAPAKTLGRAIEERVEIDDSSEVEAIVGKVIGGRKIGANDRMELMSALGRKPTFA